MTEQQRTSTTSSPSHLGNHNAFSKASAGLSPDAIGRAQSRPETPLDNQSHYLTYYAHRVGALLDRHPVHFLTAADTSREFRKTCVQHCSVPHPRHSKPISRFSLRISCWMGTK